MHAQNWHRHVWANRLQTLLLVVALLGIGALAGALLLGENGMWIALGACLLVLLLAPATSSRLTLRLYGARPIQPSEAPDLWQTIDAIAARAGLPAPPVPHYVPSPVVNAFAVGSRRHSAIAMTDGLLRSLTPREIAGVLAHETAHIAHGDLRVMGLADYVSRLTNMFSLAGQALLLLSLPWLFTGTADINWPALLLLIASPHIARLAQLGLSRIREFDADYTAARLTDDPQGLAAALVRIERAQRSWRSLLLPGWGNPEPSWLRTHPATEERIRRLLASYPEAPGQSANADWGIPDYPPPQRSAPRWHPGGFWH